MKKISLPLLAAAAAAVVFAGCSVEEMIGSAVAEAPSRTLKVNFSASNSATRTSFSGFNEEAGVYPVIWSGQEAVVMSLDYDDPADATVTKITDSHATFSGAFNDTGSPYIFYALCPSSAATAISESRKAWAVNIPVEQTPGSGTCDEAAQVIVAVSEQYASIPDPVQLHFSHVTTYVRVTLKNLDAAVSAAGVESPAVTSFDLTFEVPVAGEWYYDFENKAISEKDASYTVRALTSDLTDVWLALAPCDLGGKSLKVSVNTDKGSFVRTVAFPSGRKYAAGKVNTLSVNMASAEFKEYAPSTEEEVYELVTSLDGLSTGDEVIFMDKAVPTTAMGAASGNSGMSRVTGGSNFVYTASDKFVRLPDGSGVLQFTIGSKSGSSLTFKTGNNYLSYSTSGFGNRRLTTSTTSRTWTVDVSTSGAAKVYISGSTSYYVTAGSSYYTLSTTSSTVTLWKKVSNPIAGNPDPDSDPILQYDVFGAYLTVDKTLYEPGESQLSREYLDESVTFAIIYPSGNSVLEFSGIPQAAAKGEAFDLTLVSISGRKRTALGTFRVTVVKEDGPCLWLSDFIGNGFIVKR